MTTLITPASQRARVPNPDRPPLGGDLAEALRHLILYAGDCLSRSGGAEYTARTFQAACTPDGHRAVNGSGRVGSALDNAVIESWHSMLEFELRRRERFATKAVTRTQVAAWIDEYNRDRKHSACGMRSPIGYEQALRASQRPGRTRAARTTAGSP